MDRRKLLLLTSIVISGIFIGFAAFQLRSLSASSEQKTASGAPVPGCGTAEEQAAGGKVTLDEARKLVDACLAANSPTETSPSPSASDTTITFPLKEPETIVLSNGKQLELPAGAGLGQELGWFADLTLVTVNESRIYFESQTWKPYVTGKNATPYVAGTDRPAMRKIVEQLAADFPQYQTDYDSLTNSYLRDDLPEQAPVPTLFNPNTYNPGN
jgi:hypothetical protein